VTILTTCAEDHFTWDNARPPGRQQVGKLDVHYFPVDEDRDVQSFLRIQGVISRRGRVTEAEEESWIRNGVGSQALYDHLREHEEAYDRVVLGPYLFGLIYFAAQVLPHKSVLVPCLHDEPFAYLGIMHKLFESVAGFMFNAEPERDLAQRLFRIPAGRDAVVGMGLEPFTVEKGATRRRLGLKAPYLLYSGRREPLKGTPLLLDYLDAFRSRTGVDVKLVLTGSGPFDPPAALAPHVHDLGFVSEQEKHEVMADALAFVHPSVNESLGIVLLEAWLAGTPGLVHGGSDVLRWQCEHSNGGLWFRAYPEFEECLLLLLRDENTRQAMGEAGRHYVLGAYTWDAVEQRMFAALKAAQA
jgi:glycosyltransferase involved in cell wall biosynthesis